MNLVSLSDWRNWVNPRRPQCWLLGGVALYSLLGFVVVPWQLKQQLPALSADLVKRTATVAAVSFNPWSLQLEAQGLLLSDTDNTPLLTVDELQVNLQLRSLFRLALVFADIRLGKPQVYVTRYNFAESNIGNLLAELEGDAPPPEAPAGELLRLVIDSLAIDNGTVVFVDRMPAEPFSTEFGPINIGLENLSTLPEDSGAQEVSIRTETGAVLSWSGELTLNPLLSTGQLKLSGSPLPLVHRYLGDQLNFGLDNCCLDVALDYTLAATSDGGIEVAVRNLAASLRELTLTGAGGDRLFTLPELRVDGGAIDWPAATARLESISVVRPQLAIRLLEDGTLNLQQLLTAPPAAVAAQEATNAATEEPEAVAASQAAATEADGAAWDISLGRFAVDDMQVSFTDSSIAADNQLQLTAIGLTLAELTNRPNSRTPLEFRATVASGGSIAIDGDIAVLPAPDVRLEARLDDIALQALQPWVAENVLVAIDAGTLSTALTLASDDSEALAARGSVRVDNLSVRDTTSDTPLVGWQALLFDDLRVGLDAGELEVSSINLTAPFARLLIDAAGSTNFQSLAKGDGTAAAAEPAPAAETTSGGAPFSVRIGETNVRDGKLDFTDLNLPLPFRALISEFTGDISAFASDSAQASKLDFAGKVGEFGYSTITGSLNLLDPTAQADVTVLFRNVAMPELSPYTAEFVGQKIKSGKLDLDLRYRFDQRLIRGDNKVVLKQFELGEKIDNPDALDLPLGLAVGLLRDVNGVIDLNLAVSGDMDDPSFSASGIILKAFANLITKAVAAPFKLLGSLVPGLGGEDSSVVYFAAGSAALTPPEREKLVLIAEALLQRPALVIDVPGGTVPDADIPGLQTAAAAALVQEELGAADADDDDQLLRRKTRALERLVRRNVTEINPRDLREQFRKTDGSEELDEVAYLAELEQRLAAAQVIGADQLEQLALARRAAITDILATTALPQDRVRTTAKPAKADKEGRVALELGLEAP